MSKVQANIARTCGLGCVALAAHVAHGGGAAAGTDLARTSLLAAPLWLACALLCFILAELVERRP